MGFGDRLAGGQKSAMFSSGGEGVTQQRWDEIFPPELTKKVKVKKNGKLSTAKPNSY